LFFIFVTAVEILGMSLATDVKTSFDDPISEFYVDSTLYIAQEIMRPLN